LKLPDWLCYDQSYANPDRRIWCRRVRQGEIPPWWMGFAWDLVNIDSSMFVVVPLHFFAGWIRWLWHWIKFKLPHKIPDDPQEHLFPRQRPDPPLSTRGESPPADEIPSLESIAFESMRQSLQEEIQRSIPFITGRMNDEEVWMWRGVQVPEFVVTEPQKIIPPMIFNERNIEVRRVMIERYREIRGDEQFIEDMQFELIDDDPEWGKLWKRGFGYAEDVRYESDIEEIGVDNRPFDDEPILMVQVVNATPDEQGNFRDYFIRVPPQITRAKEAVAWTFDMKPDDYNPEIQT
jgi:hypothetical protein